MTLVLLKLLLNAEYSLPNHQTYITWDLQFILHCNLPFKPYTSTSLPTLATYQHTRVTTSLDCRTLSSKPLGSAAGVSSNNFIWTLWTWLFSIEFSYPSLQKISDHHLALVIILFYIKKYLMPSIQSFMFQQWYWFSRTYSQWLSLSSCSHQLFFKEHVFSINVL